MIDYKTAVQQVADAGIPIRNVFVSMGDVYDYQDHPDVPRSDPVAFGPWWAEGNADVKRWRAPDHPEIATRRWAYVFAERISDDERKVVDLPVGGRRLVAIGWLWDGDGGFRIEVDPSTCPARPA